MNRPLHKFGLISAAAFTLSLSPCAFATTYNGNKASGFDGAVGNGILSFTSDGTTLTGTITNGSTTSGFNDTLVIYIDDVSGGFTDTSTLTDSGTPADSDNLRASISGYNSTTRAPLTFPTGFGADYAIAIGPVSAGTGGVFTLSSASGFTYGSSGSNGGINLSPTTTGTNATYTFSLPLSVIGSPNSFTFVTTYLSGGTSTNGSAYRSNEAFGNTITDATNTSNIGNVGQDTGSITASNTFAVPEPGTWAVVLGGFGLLTACRRLARKA